jgi:cell division protein FtsW (lipid II flippase)
MNRPVWRNFDLLLLVTTFVLLTLGIALIYSATVSTEYDTVLSERLFFRQAAYAVAGLLILMLVSAVDYRLLGLASWPVYAFAIALLALVAALGQEGFGAQSWLSLRRGIQPSELTKILLIIFLAKSAGHGYGAGSTCDLGGNGVCGWRTARASRASGPGDGCRGAGGVVFDEGLYA